MPMRPVEGQRGIWVPLAGWRRGVLYAHDNRGGCAAGHSKCAGCVLVVNVSLSIVTAQVFNDE